MKYPNQKYFPEVQNPVVENPDGSKDYDETNHPLNLLYGLDSLEKAPNILTEINKSSNIDIFDKNILSTGISFSAYLAEKVLMGEEQFPPKSLKDHFSRSFGEATMFHHQCEQGAFFGK